MSGLTIIIFTNSIFLLLPKFRGYALYGRGDTLTHLGYIKDILRTGHVGGSNFYPVLHIMGSSLIKIAGLPLESVPNLFFVLFSTIYIINVYLLAKAISNQRGQILLITTFASPLIYSFFHVNIHPSILSLFMVPSLVYFYQKREKLPYGQRNNTVLLFLLAFFITFFHPVTTLFVIVVFLIFGLVHTLYSRFLSQYESMGRNFGLGVSLIMFITFFAWYFSYASIQRSFKVVYDWLVYQIGTPLIEAILKPLAEAELTPLQILELFINRDGAIFLSLLISGVACVSVLIKSLSRKHNVEPMKFAYAIQFLIALLIGVTMLFGYFVEYESDPVRLFRLPLLMGTILSGLVVYDFINKRKTSVQRSWFVIVIAMAIMVMVGLSLGSVYGSPRVCGINFQVTQMEIAGTKWFGRLKDANIAVASNTPQQILRFEDYNFGVDSSSITRAKLAERLPSHFGYDKYNRIAEALGFQDRYLVIFKLDLVAPMLYPENVRSKVHQYTEDDFAKLSSDPMAAKLYCNGEFEVWRIYKVHNVRDT